MLTPNDQREFSTITFFNLIFLLSFYNYHVIEYKKESCCSSSQLVHTAWLNSSDQSVDTWRRKPSQLLERKGYPDLASPLFLLNYQADNTVHSIRRIIPSAGVCKVLTNGHNILLREEDKMVQIRFKYLVKTCPWTQAFKQKMRTITIDCNYYCSIFTSSATFTFLISCMS